MGYSGTHGTEDIKRQKMLSKPMYFQKNFEKAVVNGQKFYT
jgi:hypothetical protein